MIDRSRLPITFPLGRQARIWPPTVPLWSIGAYCVCIFLAFSPSLLWMYGIHNDYEMLIFKSHGFWFHEAEHLFSIGRPVGALLSNLTLLPVEKLSGFRWTRLFGVLTVCILGYQMISICIRRLNVEPLVATTVAVATFLVPAFIYSVLNAPAWATHLIPAVTAFIAYNILSRSNVQALAFIGICQRKEYGQALPRMIAYCCLRSVLLASLVLQLGLYNFPPDALIIATLPVVLILFSRAPTAYKYLLVVRDVGFIVVNLAVYAVTARLIYIPIVRLLTSRNTDAWRSSHLSKFEERIATSYNYKFNTDPAQMFDRLHEVAKVAGDVWLLPQTHMHLAVGAVILAATALKVIKWCRQPSQQRPSIISSLIVIVLPVMCFVLSASAVLGSGGGFVSYRTIPIPIAIAAIVFIYSAWIVTKAAVIALTRSASSGARAGYIMLVVLAIVAVVGNFQMNYLTMKLARNETAYFQKVVRNGLAEGAKAFAIVDPRPFSLPEDHNINYDENGNAVPPFELACFSGFCLQTGAIVSILAEQAGVARENLRVFTIRDGDPIPNAKCELLTDDRVPIPSGTSDEVVGTIRYIRTFRPLACLEYTPAWRNIDVDLSP